MTQLVKGVLASLLVSGACSLVHGADPGAGRAALGSGGAHGGTGSGADPGGPAIVERIDIEAALRGARLTGLADQIELIVPLPLNDEARAIGAVGRQLSVKGVCGPDGAAATPELLFEHARRDLERMNNPQRGALTLYYGESPKFAVTIDPSDVLLLPLFLPSFQAAAEFVDLQLDDRIEIRIDLSTQDLPGSVIGSASSESLLFNYETYRRGLVAAARREPEEPFFAGGLPVNTLPVRYDNSATTTAEGLVVANETQIRAIFGDNAIAQGTAITIRLDNTANWDYFVHIDHEVDSGTLSLVDVAVHEITHGLGFRSQIDVLGVNSNNRVAGLDIARFRGFPAAPFGIPGGAPVTAAQFTTFPRWGDNLLITDPSMYARVNSSNAIEIVELEGGDLDSGFGQLQPSHLAYRQNFSDKLGLMDPVLSNSETFGPAYWGSGERGPLNDMGWKIIRSGDLLNDCNGNGFQDIYDIAINGFRDADNDLRLDVCEFFYDDVSAGGTYIDRLTETIYDANGATNLNQFNPNVNPVLSRRLVSSLDADYLSNDDDTVREFSGFIFAPAADEYSFRVVHENDVKLEIASEGFFFSGAGNLNTLTNPSLPVFVQLEQGWHAFKLTVLISEPGPLRLRRESRSLGGWGPVPISNFTGTFFVDCNNNSIDDQFDPDSDGDGIPDDCDEPDCDDDGIPDNQELDCDGNGVPDDCEPRGDINSAFYVGVAGTSSDLLEFGTCNAPAGFQFDTEIAIWDAGGSLIAQNDDETGCNTALLSRLNVTLPAGEYFIGITGYNSFFSEGFGIDFATNACSDGGLYALRVGNAGVVIGEVVPGKIDFLRFEIEAAPSCPADIALPFGTLNFFDLAAYIGLFNAGSPDADLAAPFGALNFFDVAAYLGFYNAGCP